MLKNHFCDKNTITKYNIKIIKNSIFGGEGQHFGLYIILGLDEKSNEFGNLKIKMKYSNLDL